MMLMVGFTEGGSGGGGGGGDSGINKDSNCDGYK